MIDHHLYSLYQQNEDYDDDQCVPIIDDLNVNMIQSTLSIDLLIYMMMDDLIYQLEWIDLH